MLGLSTIRESSRYKRYRPVTGSVPLGSPGGEELVDLEGAELRLESRLGFKWMREVDE